jgi:hypothetical protein
MKKLNLSTFDLGMIIAFVVIGLLGGGAWWYLSGQLQAAQDDCKAAYDDFNKNSTSEGIVVSGPNKKILQDNIKLLKARIIPLIQDKLVPKENKLASIDREDPVAWKHDLDDEVRRLTDAAKAHGVKIPSGFYFAFSRYLNENPDEDQTIVLSKQLLAVQQITTALVNAPVKGITSIGRTYEEDNTHSDSPGGGPGPNGAPDAEHLPGYSFSVGNGAYTAYPFEVEFDASTATFRKFVDDLLASPYIFVIRSVSVQNLQPSSPHLDDLDKIAGATAAPSVTDSPPGQVAATTSVAGPQYLFGNASLHVKIRIDLIEWDEPAPDDN